MPLGKRLGLYLAASATIGASALLSRLPVDVSSAIAGKIVRFVGPFSRRHRSADAALRRFLPRLTELERRQLLRTMWENVGRIFGELTYIDRIIDDPARFSFDGFSEIMQEIEDGRGVVAISGHFGNWELSRAPSYLLKRRQVSFYRAINNPPLERYVRRQRARIATGELIAKEDNSLRRAMQALADGNFIGMMVDLRESRGIMVPFMGVDTPTNHAPALLALRYGAPLLAGIVVREKGVKFRMICKKVAIERTGDRKADIFNATRRINELFEQWIREHPEQWLWTLRRWETFSPRRSSGGRSRGES